MNGSFGSLPKALSTALLFSLAMSTFFPEAASCAEISAMTCVLPVPGGPWIRNIPLDETALSTASCWTGLRFLRKNLSTGCLTTTLPDDSGLKSAVARNGFIT